MLPSSERGEFDRIGNNFDFVSSENYLFEASRLGDLSVYQINKAPVLDTLNYITNEDTPLDISLIGTDTENDTLAVEVVETTKQGMLNFDSVNNKLVYHPTQRCIWQ